MQCFVIYYVTPGIATSPCISTIKSYVSSKNSCFGAGLNNIISCVKVRARGHSYLRGRHSLSSEKNMKQNPVYRSGVSIGLSCQGLLRLAIVSALGACTLGLSGGARADSICQGSPTQNISAGSYTYGYAVC